MMSALPLASARLKKLHVNSISKRSFTCRFISKYLLFPHFVFFVVLKHDFIRCFDFTRIAASNTASDDFTN